MAENFTVHKVFGDHMVLQRDLKIRISGTCPEKQAVKVSLAGKTATAFADSSGEWEAILPAMPAGGPHVLTVSGAGGKSIEFTDIMIGEVWLCSGQSNMSMPLWSNTQFWRTDGGDIEAQKADHPHIRLYNVNPYCSVAPDGPESEIKGAGWTLCTPETAPGFSAAGYYFGKQLHADLGVPIGLINSSWGGTPIQSWISRQAYQLANRQNELDQIDSLNKEQEEQKRVEIRCQMDEWEELFLKQNPEKSEFAAGYSKENWDDSAWPKVHLPAPVTANLQGVFWHRREVEVPVEWENLDLELGLGPVDDIDETWFNGQLVGKTGTNEENYWKKKRVYRIPAGIVKAGKKNSIAVRMINFEGAVGMEGPAEDMFIRLGSDKNKSLPIDGEWKYQVEFKADPYLYPAKPKQPPGRDSAAFPSTLFNSMIAPWCKYTIRGAIWYQGESNAAEHADYLQLQKILLADWRRQWNNPDLAFILTQLSAFHSHNPSNPISDRFWEDMPPGDDNWCWLREAQRAMLKQRKTGMAVTIDIGDHSDIHPANKKTVGYRLAKEAQRVCYGYREVSAGPLYKKMEREGNRVRLYFDNIGSGLEVRGDELKGFAVAGKDGRFYWAEARIDGNTILVESKEVPEPCQVRYAWAKYPGNANLYNAEGFPASPFQALSH